MYFAYGLWLLYAIMDGSQILKYLLSDSQQKKFADPIARAPGYKGLIPKGSHLRTLIRTKIILYLAFTLITRESTIPKMNKLRPNGRADLNCRFKFSQTALYIVLFLVLLSPKICTTLNLIYFYCLWVFGFAPRQSKPSSW